MKLLFSCALMILLSGCIPIGLQGRTSAIDAPGGVAARSTATPAATLAAHVSV